jgi:ABC-type multidrug transport system fused ATPase/permease subunit
MSRRMHSSRGGIGGSTIREIPAMKKLRRATQPGLIRNLKVLFGHLPRRRRWQLAALVVLALLGAVAEMATLGAVLPFLALLADPSATVHNPWLSGFFSYFNRVGNLDVLSAAAVVFAVIAIGGAIVRTCLTWVSVRYSTALGTDIGCEVYRRTLYQPFSFHVSRNSSEIIAGLNKVPVVIAGVISPIILGFVALLLVLAILGMLMRIDPFTATAAGLGFSVLYIAITFFTRLRLARSGAAMAENEAHRLRAIQEGLGGIRDIIIDGAHPIYIDRYRIYDVATRQAQAAYQFVSMAPRYLIEAIGMILIVALGYVLGHRQGGLSFALPVLGALAVGGQRLLPQMQQLYSSWSALGAHSAILADVVALLEQPIPSEYLEVPSPNGLRLSKGIVLRNVCFRYNDGLPDVICNASLEIRRGDRIGFIGKTGSGKSTLIDLVLGLLQPTSGGIYIDDQALTCQNRRAWQARISHVPQAIYLADSSIAENIAFAVNPACIDFERVSAAAEKAQLAEFIETLPHKYQTQVGERGVRLSGGQRQRIGIARALYKESDIIIFDEATSALDDETEASVMQAIDALGINITVLMIAHRVSTLRNCNQIIELTKGKVMRRGTFEQIILQDRKSKNRPEVTKRRSGTHKGTELERI